MKSKYNKFIIQNEGKRCDVTPIFGDAKVFASLINDLIKPFKGLNFDVIVGLDALGFIIGGAMAIKMKKGFVPIRKGGKLPGNEENILRVSFKDYSHNEKDFEMNKGSIKPGERVLVVDEWIETGTQMKAAIELIEKQGGKVIGIAAINVDRNANTEVLFTKYNCKPLQEG